MHKVQDLIERHELSMSRIKEQNKDLELSCSQLKEELNAEKKNNNSLTVSFLKRSSTFYFPITLRPL